MIDSTISMLGSTNETKVEAISTETENATGSKRYTINGVKKMAKDSSVACHRQAYPYAVFYCHKTSATEVYMVSLVGDHGGKAEAPVICHLDTSAWDPEHMAFVLLKVAPGTVPICHFLPKDHVVWIKK
ncbi:hypothetical protein Leryth_013411 [Lithospermum erythrorhizon]|nr:hypothetical protein Leryth_013411 [Lithospermum erythrorhizon]